MGPSCLLVGYQPEYLNPGWASGIRGEGLDNQEQKGGAGEQFYSQKKGIFTVLRIAVGA